MRTQPAKSMRVLIVDDSQLVADRLQAMLDELGYETEIQSVDRLSLAIDAVDSSHPRLVILDLVLPEGVTFQLISYIKSISPETAIVVFTNYAFKSYRDMSIKNGADHFLDKSLDFDQIPVIVNALVETSD